MLSRGWECNFKGTPPRCDLVCNGKELGSVPLVNHLCFLSLQFVPFDAPLLLMITPQLSAFLRVSVTHDLWHAHIGHVSGEAAKRLLQVTDGVAITESTPLSVCESCIVAKHPRKPFHISGVNHTTAFLDLVHADLAGPMLVATPHGKHYFMVILDDFTHVLDLHLLASKDQVLEAWEITQCCWETKASRRVKAFQSDNGGEFLSKAFVDTLNSCGILHHLSVPYMHKQNGTAEQVIRTIEGCLLAMLHQVKLPLTYWGEAALMVAYLHNHLEMRVLPTGVSPYQMLNGVHSNLSHLHVWGCCAFAHMPAELQTKLGPKSCEVLFMGYPPGIKGYCI
jgi:Integrase core domain